MNYYSKIKSKLFSIYCTIYYGNLLAQFGVNAKIFYPARIENPKKIFIGDKVYIDKNAWLAANPLTGNKNCALIIGEGTSIGRSCHIYATSKIEIGKKVLIAEKVYISDNLHSYDNINMAIIDQPIKQLKEVHIGDGAWLGENVCIIGASVGKNCVVGANAVVIKNIPDYCVVVGAPAIIIKRYNFHTNTWQKTNDKGDFI